MADKETEDSSINSGSVNKPSNASTSPTLPPLGTATESKNKNVSSGGPFRNSFQLDPKDQKIIGKKKWMHWALLFIPLGILISVVVLLWAYYFNGSTDEPISEEPKSAVVSEAEPEATLAPLPIIKDENKITVLQEYFSTTSPNWKNEFISKVPDVAADAYEKYRDANDDDRLEQAQDFYVYLNNPGVEETDEGFISFLNDVRADLENAVGQPLF